MWTERKYWTVQCERSGRTIFTKKKTQVACERGHRQSSSTSNIRLSTWINSGLNKLLHVWKFNNEKRSLFFIHWQKYLRQLAHNTRLQTYTKHGPPGFVYVQHLVAIAVMHLYPEFEKTCFGQPSFESLTPESMPFIDAPSWTRDHF